MSQDRANSGELFKIEHDLLNEQIVLATAITDPVARGELLKRVKPDHFVVDEHSAIWTAMLDANRRRLEPTAATLAQLGAGVVDQRYLSDLAAMSPVAANVGHHLEQLLWDAGKVRAIKGPLASLLDALRDPKSSPQRVRALAEQLPTAFAGAGSRSFLRDSDKLVKEHARTIALRMQGHAVFPFGVAALDTYGPTDVDRQGNSLHGTPLLIPGAAPKQVTVVTGISGGGKSTVTSLLALNLARQGRKVLFGAWEMTSEAVLELMACISLKLSRSRVMTGRITAAEATLLTERMEAIAEYVKFCDMPFGREQGVRKKSQEVLDEIHSYIADSGCEVAVFDLWRRAFSNMRDEGEEAEALFRQQAIFQETATHGILVQQQRLKDIETRVDQRPTRDGIKGSSAWVDVADTVLGIHIPALLKGAHGNTIETLVLKQRFGRWPLCIEHSWDGDLVSLTGGRVVEYSAGSEQDLGTKNKAWLHKKPEKKADKQPAKGLSNGTQGS